MAGADDADTVAHGYSIDATSTALWAMVHGEEDSLTLAQRNDGGAGLHTRALFRQYKLATCEVAAGLAKKDGSLDGKDELAVEILVEAVVIVLLVFEKKRCRPRLSGLMAELLELLVYRRVSRRISQVVIPLVRDGGERRIESIAEALNQRWKRVAVVLILATPKAVTGHHHAAAKSGGILVAGGKLEALLWSKQRAGGGIALLAKGGRDTSPIKRYDLFRKVHGFTLALTVRCNTPVCIVDIGKRKRRPAVCRPPSDCEERD
jgi:hypothetical protein